MATAQEEGKQEESINAAIAEALKESEFDAEAQSNDWTDFGEQDTGAESVEGTSSTAEPPTTVEASSEGETTTEEPPTSYWGVDLSDIPAEKRRDVIAHFEQQDSTIRKLQERLSTPQEAEQAAPQAEEEVAIEDVSDEDLLRAAGYDPEDFETQRMAPYMLPLLRTQLANEEKLDQLYRNEQVRTVQSQWNQQLDDLEGKYGKLPGDRVQVLREAATQGYANPFEAYFRIAAPVRREVEEAATAARRDAGRSAAGASPRPTSVDGEEPPITKDMSLRDAVAKAAKAAQKETGMSWRDSVKNPFARSKS